MFGAMQIHTLFPLKYFVYVPRLQSEMFYDIRYIVVVAYQNQLF